MLFDPPAKCVHVQEVVGYLDRDVRKLVLRGV
jgi:hypothetical protein